MPTSISSWMPAVRMSMKRPSLVPVRGFASPRRSFTLSSIDRYPGGLRNCGATMPVGRNAPPGGQERRHRLAEPVRLRLGVGDCDQAEIGEAVGPRKLAVLRDVAFAVGVVERPCRVAGAERRHRYAALAEHARVAAA